MDRSYTFIAETFKNLIGFGLIIFFPEVLNIYEGVNIPILLSLLLIIFSDYKYLLFFEVFERK